MFDQEPQDKNKFTLEFDKVYGKYAGIYDWAVKYLPVWKSWIKKALPYIKGPKVLEVSFGTGYLLTQYAHQYETYGIDYNAQMVELARKNLEKKGINACLVQGDVEKLPYADQSFDSVVNTMAFSGYPDGKKALSELLRVLKKEGSLITDITQTKKKWL